MASSKPAAVPSAPAPINDNFDITLPATNNDTCHVMIQIDPNDVAQLDLEGASGAIGRFECSSQHVVLDCKGYQYQGTIHPGPTVMVLSHTNGDGELKVDAITNEFVTLSQIDNVMEKLNAVMVQGSMDDGYKVVDDNVNSNKKEKEKVEDVSGLKEPPKKRAKTEKAAAKPKKRATKK